MDDQTRAERVGEYLWARDRVSPSLGMELQTISAGHAVITMLVRADMVNGHNICHGGMIFSLADSAFAYACNSRNQSTLAQHNSITYLSPARLGEPLRAEAHEVSLTGRSGIYDVAVSGKDGRKIAEFRGLSRQIGDQHIDESTETDRQESGK
ncbi:MAG: hydroxyphenylacetyl-CoA thioesterase PaaI [Rhodobacteraceae bacterium]|nr:hydroxyphenylacetyl-CoA thioesterase PaaI [Paracoccaceae bacterium]